ncbi:hypothetical protein AB0878_26220 [Amycolatopsis sp. NPDC047767]
MADDVAGNPRSNDSRSGPEGAAVRNQSAGFVPHRESLALMVGWT